MDNNDAEKIREFTALVDDINKDLDACEAQNAMPTPEQYAETIETIEQSDALIDMLDPELVEAIRPQWDAMVKRIKTFAPKAEVQA